MADWSILPIETEKQLQSGEVGDPALSVLLRQLEACGYLNLGSYISVPPQVVKSSLLEVQQLPMQNR